MQKIAHIDEEREQSVYEHLENVSKLAAYFCRNYKIPEVNVQDYAATVGYAHDIGKYSALFQNKIKNNLNISVDHSTAGAKELIKLKMTAGAFAVAGHHGGIPNGKDYTSHNLLSRVKDREIEPYSEYRNEINLNKINDPNLGAYDEAFFTRMLFSALVDADFLDTEKFMSVKPVVRGEYDSIEKLYERLMKYIKPWRKITDEAKEINKIRSGILEQCLKSGQKKKGIYSLTVPTGGGKTISSLAFALEHARTNNLDRVIYVIPYNSIIEQNVAVFRDILGEQNVIAHYGNSLLCSDNENVINYEKHKLSIENWDAPVVVTTNVQFFESMYSNKVSKCRKLHNIANSVVIFDEVQMIPLNYLKPCVRVIQNLVESYGVSAVLCTATQPALEKWLKPMKINEICSDYKELFKKLKRTQIKDAGEITVYDLLEKMHSEQQVLVIVNKRENAHRIYEKLDEDGAFHLSTYMTPADRKNTFQKIRACLKSGKTCRVVSTSLIEAGVDLDFPTVYREMAGIDSIIQAAGRCNREGTHRWEDSIVWVFRMGEILQMIQKNAVITEETFQKYGKYDDLEAVNYYFSSIQGLDVELLDQYHIIDGFEKGIDGIQMPFEKTAEKFHLINSDTRMLIIPVHAEAAELTCELERRISSGDNFKSILQKLGTYSVNVYEYEYESLIGEGHAYELLDGIAVLQNLLLYSEKMGLKYEKGNEILFV